MWKWKENQGLNTPSRPEQPVSTTAAPGSVVTQSTAEEVVPVEAPKPFASLRVDIAHIGKSVMIKGELSGSEDLYLDGEVEGSIVLHGHKLTIGPNGHVRASIDAREVVVQGKLDGNVQGAERVELDRSAVFVGDISAQRVAVEEGAYFKGSIDIIKGVESSAKPDPRPEPSQAAAVGSAALNLSVGGKK